MQTPDEMSRWWLPGQHLAGGEKPAWVGRSTRLHHALRFGDEVWAACWQAGLRVIDVADIRRPRTVGEYNYHPPFPGPAPGKPSPQTNDVDVDTRGLIYIVDRHAGSVVLEFER